MAERLGRGLQNLVHQFESGSDLQAQNHFDGFGLFFALSGLTSERP